MNATQNYIELLRQEISILKERNACLEGKVDILGKEANTHVADKYSPGLWLIYRPNQYVATAERVLTLEQFRQLVGEFGEYTLGEELGKRLLALRCEH